MSLHLRSRILQYFPQECLFELENVRQWKLAKHNNEKVDKIISILEKYKIDYNSLGPGTNRFAVLIDNYVFKIAMDDDGWNDNYQEFMLSYELQPYVIKVYECNGLIVATEYVTLISKEEFVESKEAIREILSNIVTGYLVGDVGTISKNYLNWGYRDDGDLIILDFAYFFPLSKELLRCGALVDKDTGRECDGILNYDSNFHNFICPKCGAKHWNSVIRSRISGAERQKEIEVAKMSSFKLTEPVIVHPDPDEDDEDYDGYDITNEFGDQVSQMPDEEDDMVQEDSRYVGMSSEEIVQAKFQESLQKLRETGGVIHVEGPTDQGPEIYQEAVLDTDEDYVQASYMRALRALQNNIPVSDLGPEYTSVDEDEPQEETYDGGLIYNEIESQPNPCEEDISTHSAYEEMSAMVKESPVSQGTGPQVDEVESTYTKEEESVSSGDMDKPALSSEDENPAPDFRNDNITRDRKDVYEVDEVDTVVEVNEDEEPQWSCHDNQEVMTELAQVRGWAADCGDENQEDNDSMSEENVDAEKDNVSNSNLTIENAEVTIEGDSRVVDHKIAMTILGDSSTVEDDNYDVYEDTIVPEIEKADESEEENENLITDPEEIARVMALLELGDEEGGVEELPESVMKTVEDEKMRDVDVDVSKAVMKIL